MPLPFECSSQNNNSASAAPEPETNISTKTKLTEPVDDGLIDSFEIKIREAFRREEDPSREGLAAKILEGSSKEWKSPKTEVKSESDVKVKVEEKESGETESELACEAGSGSEMLKDWSKEDGSPSLEDMERFRVKPPLYTYAKREDSLSPSPTTVEGNELRYFLFYLLFSRNYNTGYNEIEGRFGGCKRTPL